MTVRIVGPSGAEVPGRFVAAGIWRPEELFEIGRYTADVTYEPNPSRAEDRDFEVIGAMEPSLDFVEIQVTSKVQAGEVLTQACCEAGTARVDHQPCAANCAPLCIPLTYAVRQFVEVYYAFDSDSPLADQTIIRTPNTTNPDQYVQGVWPIEGEPDALCGVAEVFSWLDESVVLAETCLANTDVDLSPIAESVVSFGHITECSRPPADYLPQWCDAQAYTCETEAESLKGTEHNALVMVCADYYRLCNRSEPESTGSAAPGDGGTSGPEGNGAPISEDSSETSLESNEGNSSLSAGRGCALQRSRSSGSAIATVTALVAVGLVYRRNRRVRWTL